MSKNGFFPPVPGAPVFCLVASLCVEWPDLILFPWAPETHCLCSSPLHYTCPPHTHSPSCGEQPHSAPRQVAVLYHTTPLSVTLPTPHTQAGQGTRISVGWPTTFEVARLKNVKEASQARQFPLLGHLNPQIRPYRQQCVTRCHEGK